MNPVVPVTGRLLESIEAEAWSQLYSRAAPDTARDLGLAVDTVAGAAVVIATGVDILANNRVIGLGQDGPVDDRTITAIIDAYAAAKVGRFMVQVAPHADAELSAQLRRHGFRYLNDWMKLYRAVSPVDPVACDLGVEPIDRRRAVEFGDVFATSFEWPRRMAAWIGALVAAPGWSHYLAMAGGRGVATGAMYVDGTSAWIDFASTLPEFRGQGAQSALVARRIDECAAAGVNTIVVEAGDGSASFRNLTRMGFVTEYRRANYVLELE